MVKTIIAAVKVIPFIVSLLLTRLREHEALRTGDSTPASRLENWVTPVLFFGLTRSGGVRKRQRLPVTAVTGYDCSGCIGSAALPGAIRSLRGESQLRKVPHGQINRQRNADSKGGRPLVWHLCCTEHTPRSATGLSLPVPLNSLFTHPS